MGYPLSFRVLILIPKPPWLEPSTCGIDDFHLSFSFSYEQKRDVNGIWATHGPANIQGAQGNQDSAPESRGVAQILQNIRAKTVWDGLKMTSFVSLITQA